MILKAIITLFSTLLIIIKQKAQANTVDSTGKYKFQTGGQDPYSTDLFGTIASYLKGQQEETPQYEVDEAYKVEEDSVIEDEPAYTDDDYTGLLEQYNDLSSEYEKLKTSQSRFQDSGDSFLSFLFEDNNNLPTVFSQDELDPDYYKRAGKAPFNTETSLYHSPASALDPDKYLSAIFGNEGGKTGVDPKNMKGHASGRFGIIPLGRKEIYNKHFQSQMSYQQFEKLYNTDANFEYQVARKLAEDKINSSKTVAEAFGSWYSPAHARSGQFNVVPERGHGNKLTVGQYVDKALKQYKQYGGAVANTKEELYNGLNGSDLQEMTLNLPSQYNLIRGLDNGQPVKLQDEMGNEDILYGSNDTQHMFGKVYEQKL